MRERTFQIHLRATEKERLRYMRNAKKCGLSLSEYLRKLANGHDPKSLPPIEYVELISLLTQMYDDFRETGDIMYAKYIAGTLSELREAINQGKGDVLCGNNENLAGS